jgi:DNA-binding NarL/FixJ family response regulator/signal transduction histidine kinase
LADALQQIIQTGQRFTEGRLWRHKDGSSVCAEARTFAIRGDDGGITGYTSVMRDIAERARAQDEIEERARQQAAVAQFGLQALTGSDLPSLMDDAVALVARTLNVEYGKIVELLPGGEELLIRAGFGWTKGMVLNQTEPADGSQAGFTLLSGEPVVTEDLASETRYRVSPVKLELGATSAVSVAIPTQGVPFGVLQALSKHRRTYSDDDVNFLRAIANVLAGAVERGESERNLREVRAGERRRIARDLHEGALWGLAHALAEAHRAQSALEDPDAAAQLGGLILALQRVGQQVDGAIHDLRLGAEVGRPFPELLESLLGLHRSTVDDVIIELDARDSTPTGPLGRTGTEVLRIVSEALTNARRHSGARRIRVGVWGTEDTLWVEVSDDGRGFDPARAPAPSNAAGIDAMRQTAAIIGADLQIRSGLGGGTRLRLEVPLRKRAERPLDETRVLLVEDHAAVRESVASAFAQEPGFEEVGHAASLDEAPAMLDEVDEAVVHLTHLDEVIRAVRRLRAGETVMPLAEVFELLRFAGTQQEPEDRLAISRLTPREREVLQALAQGLSSQEIAKRLRVAPRTERNHMASILAKLGVHSRLQALVFALRNGLVEVK